MLEIHTTIDIDAAPDRVWGEAELHAVRFDNTVVRAATPLSMLSHSENAWTSGRSRHGAADCTANGMERRSGSGME